MGERATDRFIRVQIEKMNQEILALINTEGYNDQREILIRIGTIADCVRFLEQCIKDELDEKPEFLRRITD